MKKIILDLIRNLFPKLFLFLKFQFLKRKPSDINEHLETLSNYASRCNSIFETGVRGVVSSIRARGRAVMDRGARESAARVGMTLELSLGARARVTRRRRWTTSAARGDAARGDAGECEG